MTLERRSFLELFGSSIGFIVAKNLSYAQRGGEAKAPAVSRKILVAHRGASAYAPEHTFESYQLALKQGADFVEQDLQISRDGILVCLHDLTLERTTNVKDIFPTRFREEPISGAVMRHWYVSDFTLREIKQLDAGSWFDVKFKGTRVPTFQEAIDLVRGKAGLYPETKAPEVYGARGFNMERLVIDLLKKNRLISGSAARNTPVVIQSFSPESLKKLFTTLKTALPLVLLVSDEARARWLTEAGLVEAKQFATGIGPAKALVDKTLVMQKLGVDALFTDNPDLFPRVAVP